MTIINVTADHIENGMPGSNSACAVALALQDAFPGADAVSVGDFAILFYEFGDVSGLLPEKAREFVRAFDEAGFVEPFTFELDIPAAAS